MAISSLETALTNVDSAIETLSARCADPTSYTIESLTVDRRRLEDLIKVRNALKAAIVADGSRSYEIWSQAHP